MVSNQIDGFPIPKSHQKSRLIERIKTDNEYPLNTCVVSGDKFGGDMGDPIVFVYSNKDVNQEIKFCCPMCKPKFLKDPDKYMKIIHDAEAKAKETKN